MLKENSYKVVKFIVNVRLMEKRVKSHVGKVYVNQNKSVGSARRIDSTTLPSKPNGEEVALSADFIAATEV